MIWMYANNDYNSCRYILGTVCRHPLICVGVNPSTAEPNRIDSTIRAVERVSAKNGYDGWIMINLYPQRATDPDDLDITANNKLVDSNLLYIEQLLSMYPESDIWAAWGTMIEKRAYLRECLLEINKIVDSNNCKWITFGAMSKDGHPHHPLYLAVDSRKEPFSFHTYQQKITRRT